MAETTSRVTDAATGILVREVTTGASSGVQQVISLADGASGALAQVRSTGALDVNLAQSAGNIAVTSANLTGSGVSVAANTASAGNVGVAIYGGTFTNLPISFEATIDGTNWFGITGVRTDRSVVNQAVTLPSAPAANAIYFWNFEATAYIQVRVRQTGTATAQTANPTVVIAQGPFLYDPSPVVTEAQPDTTTLTSVASSATQQTFLAANIRRRAASIYNDSTSALFLSLAGTVSTTLYTVQIPAYGMYELPYPCYTGAIVGLWSTANGAARITESYS